MIENLKNSLQFLNDILNKRIKYFLQKENTEPFIYPEHTILSDNSPLSNFLINRQINIEEYILIMLALVPHIQPNFLDSIVQQYLPNGGEFPEIGGVKGTNHRGTIPTGETALLALAGNDLEKRMLAFWYFSQNIFLQKKMFLRWKQLKKVSRG